MQLVSRWTLLVGLALTTPPVIAGLGTGQADRVLGQAGRQSGRPYFATGTTYFPEAIAIGGPGGSRVWIADRIHNRVLGWRSEAALLGGAAADLVLGQPGRNVVTATSQGSPVVRPDCPGAPAADTLCDPTGVALDATGRVFVADAGNSRILIYEDPFATDTLPDTVLGQIDLVSTPHGGTVDELRPRSLAIAPTGELWVAEFGIREYEWGGRRRLLRFDPPFADGQLPAATLPPAVDCSIPAVDLRAPCRPVDLGFDAAGALIVLVTTQTPVSSLAAEAAILVYADPRGSLAQPDRAIAVGPEFAQVAPRSLRLAVRSDGTLLLAGDLALFSTVRADPDAGWAAFPQPFAATEFPSWGVALDPAGRLLWGGAPDPDPDDGLQMGPGVRVLPPPYDAAPVVVRGRSPRARAVIRPQAIAVDRSVAPNHLFVTDEGDPSLVSGGRLLGWRDSQAFASGAPADLVVPLSSDCAGPPICGALGVAVDAHGTVFVAETGMDRVLAWRQPFETDLTVDAILGRRGPRARRLHGPGALAVDPQGTLWVADLANNRVVGYRDPLRTDLVPDVLLGQSSWACSLPSSGLFCPGILGLSVWDQVHQGESVFEFVDGDAGLAVDASGTIYVASWSYSQVAVFRPHDDIQTSPRLVLGLPGGGTRRNAFAGPTGLALDARGHLWVADTDNDRLLEFDLSVSGLPIRVLGQPGYFARPWYGSTLPAANRLWRPHGIAFDQAGSLFVADSEYHRVLALDPP